MLPVAPPTTAATCRPPFFFRAEDGIRGTSVTGVQTCALPIFFAGRGIGACQRTACGAWVESAPVRRSEERRVGKECRYPGWRAKEKNPALLAAAPEGFANSPARSKEIPNAAYALQVAQDDCTA